VELGLPLYYAVWTSAAGAVQQRRKVETIGMARGEEQLEKCE